MEIGLVELKDEMTENLTQNFEYKKSFVGDVIRKFFCELNFDLISLMAESYINTIWPDKGS